MTPAPRVIALVFAGLLPVVASSVHGQQAPFTQRGFLEANLAVYPQKSLSTDERWIGDLLLRQEAAWRSTDWLTLAGAFDARAASNDWVERSWAIDWEDRGVQRPALSVRRLGAAVRHGGFTFEAGKQFVRWGKADVLNPTDRFAPRDLLEVVDNDFLAVTAARITFERGSNTIDAVWVPIFTPSRVPLAGSRWSTVASASQVEIPLPLADLGSVFPSRPQGGVRWNHVGSGFEFSASIYDGFNNLPRIDLHPNLALGRTEVRRLYPQMRMVGGDAAWPLPWFTVKGEAGYFWTSDAKVDDYGIYVVQLERQHGEWLFVAGYAGEFVTAHRSLASSPVFAFDRGLARTFLGRASYTIDPRRTVAFEGALRQNLEGGWLEAEYSQAIGQHWRATARADLLRGKPGDFFGQYHRNSSLRLTVRYSY